MKSSWVALILSITWVAGLLSGGVARARAASPAAPPPPLRFERLTLENGLSQNAVLALFQDRQGFLWIGTQDGLNRYDGYGYTIYKNDPQNPNSLSQNSILAILQDRQGNLWAGTWGGGLNRLNLSGGQVTRYQHDPANPSSLSDDVVTSLALDQAGRLWVGTLGGLDLFNPATGSFTHYRNDPQNSNSLSSDHISCLFESADGRLWIGTGGLGSPGRGLNRLDFASGEITRYLHDPADSHSLSGDNVSSIIEDERGQLWVATGGFSLPGNGLNRLDPQTGQTTRYAHDPPNPASLSQDNLTHLFIDSAGQLWIATWGGGLDQADPRQPDLRFTHHRNDPYDPQSLSANIIWTILEDRSGVVWFGSVNGGLNKLNPQVQRFHLYHNNPANPHSLGFNVAGVFYEDRRGHLWVGTWGGGLDVLDRQTNDFRHYRHNPGDPTSLPDDTVSALLEDQGGALWVGTSAGLARLDRATEHFTTYIHDPSNPHSLGNNSIGGLWEDSARRLWIATFDGLDVLDPARRTFTHLALEPGMRVVALYPDREGYLWVGTWENGVFRLDPGSLSEDGQVEQVWLTHDPDDPNSLVQGGIWSIHEDTQGRFWFGAQGGLDRWEPLNGTQNGRFTHYTEAMGLPNSTILCVQGDGQGQLWISTNRGLARFDPQREAFRAYDAQDGLQSNEFNSGACLKDQAGRLYFGGIHGFNVFDPAEIQDNPVPPPVAITALRVFNEPLAGDLSGRAPIELSYQQNFIAFEFAGLDFHAPQKNQYAYKLDGVDRDWVQAGQRRYASYTNLGGGQYVFRVRAANSDGVWNYKGAALPITVTPPVWATGWFRLLMLAGLAAAFVLGGRWRVQAVRAQNRRLEALAAQRTAELRQTNTRLQQEIVQRQRAEEALLARAAEEAVAGERTRLARELHDAVTQTLFSASLIAEVLPHLWRGDPVEAEKSAEELRQLTRGALAEMRALLLELRPAVLTQSRFEDLLRQLSEALMGRARLPIDLHISGTHKLPPDVQVALYRITQEALNNLVKYAHASRVTIDLQMGAGGVHLRIQDDGVGFDATHPRPGSLGQSIMRERAESIGAELDVRSAPGEGTCVTVLWTPDEIED